MFPDCYHSGSDNNHMLLLGEGFLWHVICLLINMIELVYGFKLGWGENVKCNRNPPPSYHWMLSLYVIFRVEMRMLLLSICLKNMWAGSSPDLLEALLTREVNIFLLFLIGGAFCIFIYWSFCLHETESLFWVPICAFSFFFSGTPKILKKPEKLL